MRLRKIVGYLLIPLCCLLMSACSSGGDDAPPPPDPGVGSNWDQMEWDKGNWS